MHGRVKFHFDDGGIVSFGLTHHTFSAGIRQEAVVYQSTMPRSGCTVIFGETRLARSDTQRTSVSTTELIFSDKDVEAPVPVSRTTGNVGRHMILLAYHFSVSSRKSEMPTFRYVISAYPMGSPFQLIIKGRTAGSFVTSVI
jgi:hypothetical protein